MKMLLVVYAGPRPELVPELFERHDVAGWTALPRAHGAGASGRRAGTRAWPGDSAVFFAMASAERAEAVLGAVRGCAGECVPGERLHAAMLPVEQMV